MDIICFSHLRWNFVYQRPQHLLTRLAEHFRIFYFEEPFCCAQADSYHIESSDNVHVVTTRLSSEPNNPDIYQKQQRIINNIMLSHQVKDYILWYYTPMALLFTANLKPVITVFDCMDELSAFLYAPPLLKQLEKEMMAKADIVFTGGHSLYTAKRNQHANIHSFPSSIDKKHFAKARKIQPDPEDQKNIGYPRFGFYGVIDERFDIELIRGVATKRPDWNFIIVGPVVKIDESILPRNPNIHYVGSKCYNELPAYLSGWDIAMVSFALNESTKFISPTKTPEYLAGGKPVISTSIKDVVETYGNNGLVHIADTVDEFIAVAEKELNQKNKSKWLNTVDHFLADDSWDNTVTKMRQLMYESIAQKQIFSDKKKKKAYTSNFSIDGQLPAAS